MAIKNPCPWAGPSCSIPLWTINPYVLPSIYAHTHTHIIQTGSPVLIFSPTQAAPAVGGEVEESGCGTDTDPIIIIDSEEEEEEEEKESDGEREEEEEEEEKEEEDDFVVKVDLSDEDVSKGEGGRREGGREEGRERGREGGREGAWVRGVRRLLGVCRPLNFIS